MNEQYDIINPDEIKLNEQEETLVKEALLRQSPVCQPDVEGEWEKFAVGHDMAERTQESAMLNVLPLFRRRSTWYAVSAACIAIFAFLLGMHFPESANNTDISQSMCSITTVEGQHCRLQLPDGTEMWLSENTTVSYPTAFNGSERRVQLTGEAFFDVAKDSLHPFLVETAYINTKVYGTQFNVRCNSAKDWQVRLVSGSIEVFPLQTNTPSRKLVPGESVKPSGNGELAVTSTPQQAIEHLSWHDGEFLFDDMELQYVLEELSQWYQVAVRWDNKSVMNKKVHFCIDKNLGLQDALRLLNSLDIAAFVLEDSYIICK